MLVNLTDPSKVEVVLPYSHLMWARAFIIAGRYSYRQSGVWEAMERLCKSFA